MWCCSTGAENEKKIKTKTLYKIWPLLEKKLYQLCKLLHIECCSSSRPHRRQTLSREVRVSVAQEPAHHFLPPPWHLLFPRLLPTASQTPLSVSSRCWSGDTLLSPCSEYQCQKPSLLTVRCSQFTKCKLFTRVCVRMMANQPREGEEIFTRYKESNDETTNSVWGSFNENTNWQWWLNSVQRFSVIAQLDFETTNTTNLRWNVRKVGLIEEHCVQSSVVLGTFVTRRVLKCFKHSENAN